MLQPQKKANQVDQICLLPDLLKKLHDQRLNETQVNIGEAFDRCKRLQAERGFKTDAELSHVSPEQAKHCMIPGGLESSNSNSLRRGYCLGGLFLKHFGFPY